MLPSHPPNPDQSRAEEQNSRRDGDGSSCGRIRYRYVIDCCFNRVTCNLTTGPFDPNVKIVDVSKNVCKVSRIDCELGRVQGEGQRVPATCVIILAKVHRSAGVRRDVYDYQWNSDRFRCEPRGIDRDCLVGIGRPIPIPRIGSLIRMIKIRLSIFT